MFRLADARRPSERVIFAQFLDGLDRDEAPAESGSLKDDE